MTDQAAILYTAIQTAMQAIEANSLPGASPAIDTAYNALHCAYWSETPAPANRPQLRPVPA